MKWIRTQEQSLPTLNGSVLTIGNFDGVHLGHQKLLAEVRKEADALKLPAVVCTFRPHPMKILRPDLPVHRLFDYRDQSEMLETLKMDYLIEEKFTKQMSLMTGEEFLDLYLFAHFKPQHIVVGYDFKIGKNRTGDFQFLKEYSERKGIKATQIEALKIEDQIVSTTAIKTFLDTGDVESANQFLGRPYYLRGPVNPGFRRGTQIGVPTANISPEVEFNPKLGVYFTQTTVGGLIYNSITNIGINPTFENPSQIIKVETHLFDFDKDIYGQQIKVELMHFHREEKRFQNIDELKAQIFSDIHQAKAYFKI